MMMPVGRLEVSSEVRQKFDDASDGSIRALYLAIEKDVVSLSETIPPSEDIAADCERLAACVKDRAEPCFFLFRPPADAPWFLLSYVPTGCKPKARMLYATSLETVRKQIGAEAVPHTVHCTDEGSLLWGSLEAEVAGKLNPASYDARTEAEKRRDELDRAEPAMCATKSYVHGVKVTFSDPAREAVKSLAEGSINVLILAVAHETIEVDRQLADPVTPEALAALLPRDEPRFVLLRYPHRYEDAEQCSTVFLYVCPEGCKVKLRMTFSTTKASVITETAALGLRLDAKLEYGELSAITSEALYDALHAAPAAEEAATQEVVPEKPRKAMGVKVMF
eukprot:EG_transcript_15624